MASIVLSIIGCIDYLAYGTIFTRAMFLPKKTLFFFFARKAVDERWEVVPCLPCIVPVGYFENTTIVVFPGWT